MSDLLELRFHRPDDLGCGGVGDGVPALSAASDPAGLARRVSAHDSNPAAARVSAFVLVPYADEYPESVVSLMTDLSTTFDAPLVHLDLDGPLSRRLADNAATGIVPAPLFQGQGVADEVISVDFQISSGL